MTPILRRKQSDDAVREAAWIARCIGRSETAPLREADLTALASYLVPGRVEPGTVLFRAGEPSSGVWILEKKKLVEVGYREITVLDSAGLARLAQ